MTTFTDGQILTAAEMNALSTQASGAAQVANNLSDLASAATARGNLGITGVGTAAVGSGLVLAGGTLSASGGSGTVTSVALSLPGDFALAGSPVTNAGTLAVTANTQTANTFKAGPATGAPTAPTYRALVTADLPAGVGTVSSVALAMPSGFSVAGSPVTNSGTLTVTRATQNANLIEAGPASGAAAVPTYRALVAADIPPVGNSMIFQTGRFYTANGIGVVSATATFLTGSLIAGTPIFIPNAITLQTLSCETAGTVTGTAHARLALYTDAGGLPGVPVAGADSGDLTQTSAGVMTSAALGVAVAPGWYWPVWESSGLAGGTIYAATNNRDSFNAQLGTPTAAAAIQFNTHAYILTHSYGTALPSPFTAYTESGTSTFTPVVALGF